MRATNKEIKDPIIEYIDWVKANCDSCKGKSDYEYGYLEILIAFMERALKPAKYGIQRAYCKAIIFEINHSYATGYFITGPKKMKAEARKGKTVQS
jgi:hypothetical protein